MPNQPRLELSHPVIDEVLATWAGATGRDGRGYRGHVYRVFNFARALGPEGSDEPVAIASVFHDLGIWSDHTFDYLEPSARRAEAFAATRAGVDADEVGRMVALHHKITRCSPADGALAEAFRRADLLDVTLGAVSFGLPRAFVAEVRAAFPNAGFHACLVRTSARWLLRYPTRPLPMMRW